VSYKPLFRLKLLPKELFSFFLNYSLHLLGRQVLALKDAPLKLDNV